MMSAILPSSQNSRIDLQPEACVACTLPTPCSGLAMNQYVNSRSREGLRRLSSGGRDRSRERDRRRLAAEAARRFPMEDTALMALLNREAAEIGKLPHR